MMASRSLDKSPSARFIRGLASVAAAICLMVPAFATSNYQYGQKEYPIIGYGKSPNGRYSITSHGEGEMGYNNFHVYLMSEPKHRKIGPLEEIGEEGGEVLDTWPGAFKASWSSDSRFVAIGWRTSHQSSSFVMYRVEHGRAYPIKVPDIVDTARTQLHFRDLPVSHAQYIGVHWLASRRFEVSITANGDVPYRSVPKTLKPYVDVDVFDGDRPLGTFEGAMQCELDAAGKNVHVICVKPAHS